VKGLKKLKAFLLKIYEYLQTKSVEDFEKTFEEISKRELLKYKEMLVEVNGDEQKFNVFVYDTILYPPSSSNQPRFK